MRNHLIIPKLILMTALFFTQACDTGAEAMADAPVGADETSAPVAHLAESDEAGPSAELMTEKADVVFVNGVVLTMEAEQPEAQAVAVQGNRILAVGSNAEIEALKDGKTRVIDLGGKTLMPGFIDTHAHTFDRLGNSYNEAQEILLQNGITSTSEFYINEEIYERLAEFENSGDLKMRVALYLAYNSSCGEVVGDWYKQYPVSKDPDDKLRVTGVKIYGDGGDCNIPAYSFDFPGLGMGDLYFEKDDLVEVFREIDANGYQIAIHTLGDRSLDVILDAYDALIAGGDNPMRHRIEHNAVVRPDQLDRFGANQLVVSVLGGYPMCRRTDPVNPLKFIIPDEFAAWEWPYRQMMDASPEAVFAWQSDSPLFGLQFISPISQLYGFTARAEVSEDGRICEAPQGLDEGRVTVDEALKMMTINAAYALFLENEAGSLSPGKFADMVVLSENPLGMAAEDIYQLQVQMTMVDGEVVFCTEEILCPTDSEEAAEETGGGSDEKAATTRWSASAEMADAPAGYAFDGDPETIWNAGKEAEEWVQIDLGSPQIIVQIRLLTAQYPAGDTVHQVWTGESADTLTLAGTLSGFTDENEELVFIPDTPLEDARVVRVVTTESPSWVAWREIMIETE